MRINRFSAARLIAVVAVLALVITACETESAGPEEGVSAQDLQTLEDRLNTLEERIGTLEEDPGAAEATDTELIGQTVTVSAEVTDPLPDDAAAFRIGGEFWTVDEGIGVISSTGEPFQIDPAEGELVQIEGDVRRFVITEFESEYGVELDDELYTDWENQIVIAAEPGNVDSMVPEEEVIDENGG